jgi:hypothetical protein
MPVLARRWNSLLWLALGGAAILAAPQRSDAAWDGYQEVQLGDQMTAEFREAPGMEVHRYEFFAVQDTTLSTVITVSPFAKGLVPEMSLYVNGHEPVELGAAKVGNKVRSFRFAESGRYHLEVRALAGTGEYTLRTRAKVAKRLNATTTTGSFSFDTFEGAVLDAQVGRGPKSSATPTITGLTYVGGAVVLGSQAGTARVTGLTLPVSGTYTLAIDPGTAGQSVRVRIRLATPRGAIAWRPGFVEDPAGIASENREKWLTSPHADRTAEAFIHWNAENPQVVPTSCARCHTTSGYRDFLGADGTAAGVVDAAAPVGQVVDCDACHNDAAAALTSVTFPSGLSVSGLGKEARCIVCHQGRESTVSVEAKITAAKDAAPDPALFTDDTVTSKLSFINVHYFAAGASLYGREAAGAYEYAEPNGAESDLFLTTLPQRKQYDRKFTHVASKDTCIECHDPHTQQVRVSDCATCHVNAQGNPVADYDDLQEIRMAGTVNDFDGDGNVTEGVAFEIKGLQAVLYTAMQQYATSVAGKPIEYKGDSYPYFFEAGTTSKFPNWTARLLRAAYNYQYSLKDPGAFAHNGKFVVEFLYDAIDDLNGALSALETPAPVANFDNLHRNDPGHFDSAAEAYRHWEADGDEEISASCSRCHSIEGFQFVAEYGIDQTVPAPLISGLSCETCHVEGTSFAPRAQNPNPDAMPERIYVPNVKFPYPSTATTTQISNVTIVNGAKGTAAQDDSLICMTCHRGRESALTVEAGDVGGLVTNFTLSVKNSHYLPAGAIQYGSKAAGMYQYAGKTYVQRYDHDQAYTRPYPTQVHERAQCSFCHMQDGSHAFEPVLNDTCTYCHINDTSLDALTPAFRAQDNWDNDTATKPKQETAVFAARLHSAIQAYLAAAKTAGKSGAEWTVFYNADNPLASASKGFYKDTDHDGALSLAELSSSNTNRFDSKSYRAAFNYRYWVNEPGAWAHNPRYILQVLYDSIVDLGGDVTGLTRP